MIKAVLALQHGLVPPVLHFTGLPDDLRRIDTGLFVPQAVTPWPTRNDETPRRAAVSSYGMSGTNVHAVLEQAPETATPHDASPAMADPLLYTVSATSAEELRNTARRLAEWAGDHADDVAPSDLAYTLARRRSHRPVRTAVVASSLAEVARNCATSPRVTRLICPQWARTTGARYGYFPVSIPGRFAGPPWRRENGPAFVRDPVISLMP